jgi:hypothetical protein
MPEDSRFEGVEVKPFGHRRRNLLLVEVVPLMAALLSLMGVFLTLGSGEPKKVDRNKLLSDIEIAISNGAELEDVKQIFENRRYLSQLNITKLFRSSETEDRATYKEPLALSSVLKDLKSEMFFRKQVNKDLVQRIKLVLSEHEKRNPFDKLEAGQRIHFESVQSKLGENYTYIQQDLNLIVDDLANKNQLVVKYLSDATRGFWISVVALIVGAAALVPQVITLWRWWRRRINA